MRRIIALSAAAFLLVACSPEAPGGGALTPPADAPAPDPAAEYRVDFHLSGTEPFWGADIVGTEIRVSRPDQPEVTAVNAGLGLVEGRAIWTAQAGQSLVMATLTRGECSDGMSDLKWPFTAELKIGEEVLKGCAAPRDAMPREGGQTG